MTFLACTVSKDGAVMSQDSWIYESSPEIAAHAERFAGVTRNLDRAAESCYVGGGDPTSVKLIGQGLKIAAVPRLNAAIGVMGDLVFANQFALALHSIRTCDLADVDNDAMKTMRSLRDQLQTSPSATIVLAGWSQRLNSGIAWSFGSSNDFLPSKAVVGETIAPMPDSDDEEYATIYELYKKANQGMDIVALHRALFAQQRRAFLAGKLAPGIGVGGDLTHCAVAADKITIETAPAEAIEVNLDASEVYIRSEGQAPTTDTPDERHHLIVDRGLFTIETAPGEGLEGNFEASCRGNGV